MQARSPSNAIEQRYFAQGEKRETGTDPGNRYYARDRQGSVQAVFDGSNQLVSAYAYGPGGKRVQTFGTEQHNIGYQGAFLHQATALTLGSEGAYDADHGRWLSPVADDVPGYAFGGNAPPASGGDPFGLLATGTYPPNHGDDILGALGPIGSTAAGLISGYQPQQGDGDSRGPCAKGKNSPATQGSGTNGVSGASPSKAAENVANGSVRFRRWARGDAIDKPMPDGTPPSWDVVRSRYWKNRSEAAAPGEFSQANLERMRRGSAPQDYNPKTRQWESRELHHVDPQRNGGSNGPFNLRELTPNQHRVLDPYRQ